MTSSVRLALVQMREAGSRDACVDAAERWINQAADQGAQVVCLPELFHGAYPCQREDQRGFDMAEPIPGDSIDAIRRIAARRDVVVVAPIFERRAPGVFHNTAVVIDADGEFAGIYRKMHIPDDQLFREKFYFSPGDLGFQPIQTKYARLGIGICWDQWFPEAARLMALAGAEILLYPSAIGWVDQESDQQRIQQHEAWQTVMQSHAITNGIWVAAANRVGTEQRIDFWGGSFVASPLGEVTAAADHVEQRLVITDCQLAATAAVRTHWPFLRDRRPDAYDDLSKRWID